MVNNEDNTRKMTWVISILVVTRKQWGLILHSSQLTLSSISAQDAHLPTDLAESQPAGGTCYSLLFLLTHKKANMPTSLLLAEENQT